MGIGQRAGSFVIQCKRVWHVLKKPSFNEWSMISKVSAIGIAIIGFIGFAVAGIMAYLGGFF